MEENNEELLQPGLISFPSVHTWLFQVLSGDGVLLTQAGDESQTVPKQDQATERFLTTHQDLEIL